MRTKNNKSWKKKKRILSTSVSPALWSRLPKVASCNLIVSRCACKRDRWRRRETRESAGWESTTKTRCPEMGSGTIRSTHGRNLWYRSSVLYFCIDKYNISTGHSKWSTLPVNISQSYISLTAVASIQSAIRKQKHSNADGAAFRQSLVFSIQEHLNMQTWGAGDRTPDLQL